MPVSGGPCFCVVLHGVSLLLLKHHAMRRDSIPVQDCGFVILACLDLMISQNSFVNLLKYINFIKFQGGIAKNFIAANEKMNQIRF
ncbi:hypothetical protein TH25_08555 [Thalassospira profundimaris]|uniref:Uncharacterized protein n=2 Tax=Thalassospira profundimaris TaxID=502049 RepID=A0A367XDG6_9PROT|nr:hypothetical protein TH25_08555 [Thalassospira profundimaris]